MKPTLKPVKRKMWLAIIPTPQAVLDRQALVLVLTLVQVLALTQVFRRKVRRRVVRLPVSLPRQQRLANSRNSLILAV